MRLRLAAAADVFGDPFNIALGIVTAAAAALVLAWAGQIVQTSPIGGVYWDLDPVRLAAIGLISICFGITVPLQVAAFRRMRTNARLRSGAGLAVGSVTGIAAVSCCSPLLLPALLGVVGAGGTTALTVNLAAHRWFIPLSALTIGLLGVSATLATRDLTRACAVAPRR